MEYTKNKIERNRLRWFGHVTRVKECGIPKKIIRNEVAWKKTFGQTTHTRWTDQIKEDLERREKTGGG